MFTFLKNLFTSVFKRSSQTAYLTLVREFQQDTNEVIPEFPSISGEQNRVSLLQEELDELAYALKTYDKVGVLDALCDLQYILSGTVLTLGYSEVFDDAFKAVHANNMTKIVQPNNDYLYISSKGTHADVIALTSNTYHDAGIDTYWITNAKGGRIIKRTADRKTLKPIGFKPVDLTPFLK